MAPNVSIACGNAFVQFVKVTRSPAFKKSKENLCSFTMAGPAWSSTAGFYSPYIGWLGKRAHIPKLEHIPTYKGNTCGRIYWSFIRQPVSSPFLCHVSTCDHIDWCFIERKDREMIFQGLGKWLTCWYADDLQGSFKGLYAYPDR